jgi:hypothetical protein
MNSHQGEFSTGDASSTVLVDQKLLEMKSKSNLKASAELNLCAASFVMFLAKRHSRHLMQMVLCMWAKLCENSPVTKAIQAQFANSECSAHADGQIQRAEDVDLGCTKAREERQTQLTQLEEQRVALTEALEQHYTGITVKGCAYKVASTIECNQHLTVLMLIVSAWFYQVDRTRLQKQCELRLNWAKKATGARII